MAKTKLTLSVDEDIREKLRCYAEERHSTMSQVLTDWVLSLKVKDPQIRGQMSFK